MNVVVKTVIVSFDVKTRQCKVLLDVHNNPVNTILTEEHKSVEDAARKSIEEHLKTDASWMPVRFLFFAKDGSMLDVYYGVLVPEEIVIVSDTVLWQDMRAITSGELDKEVKKAVWDAIKKVK